MLVDNIILNLQLYTCFTEEQLNKGEGQKWEQLNNRMDSRSKS